MMNFGDINAPKGKEKSLPSCKIAGIIYGRSDKT